MPSPAIAPADLKDPLPLARALIARPSVTPRDEGAIGILESALTALGFRCERLAFGSGESEVHNLFARRGTGRPHLCFAGHTDVVPAGDATAWSRPPFAAVIGEGRLYGRGAADMKGAIAAFVAGLARTLEAGSPKGSISLLITGDEEGEALHGTKRVVETLAARGEAIDHCLVGEPTSREALGDMIKIGRRGSLNATLTIEGVQGHVAYPYRARNPIPALLEILRELEARELDQGNSHFEPSNLEITDLYVGNNATNVIPAKARARINIRFNTQHTGASLVEWMTGVATRIADSSKVQATVAAQISGEAFFCPPGPFVSLLAEAVAAETGRRPVLSTSGGTSDARFIKDLCPVAEFGLVGTSMHKVDEHVALADLEGLARIYARVIQAYFAPHA